MKGTCDLAFGVGVSFKSPVYAYVFYTLTCNDKLSAANVYPLYLAFFTP